MPSPPSKPRILPLPLEGHGSLQYWRNEVKAAIERLEQFKPDWDRNIQSYRAKPLTSMPTSDTVVVPRDFPFVEQKIAQLFFQVPEVHLKARPEEYTDPVFVFQKMVNYELSEDGVDALTVMNEVLFDAVCPSGLLCSKIGWESFIDGNKEIEGGPPDVPIYPAPLASSPPSPRPSLGTPVPGQLPGAILGIGTPAPVSAPTSIPPTVPQMETVPNEVYARYFWERFSPTEVLIPHNFNGSNYDKGPFVGRRYDEDWPVLRKRYKLPANMDIPKGTKDSSELLLKSEKHSDITRAHNEKVRVQELYYRAAVYDPKVAHPEVIRELVLVDGLDTPLVHRDVPYQKWVGRELTGMWGFPIHLGALRYVSDSAYPPSECTISRASNEELNKSRTQMMLQRDRSIPMRVADIQRLGGETGLEKFRKNLYQSIIGLPSFDAANPPIAAVALSSFPRENFQFNDYLDRDLEQVWSMGANQRGQQTDRAITATEISKIDQWANTRLDKERRRALGYFIRGVRKLAALIQLFATDQDYQKIVGQAAARLQPWDRHAIQGKYVFTANPDSAIRVDQAQARQQVLKIYELWAKDPNVRRTELLKEACREWNFDPQRLIVEELPPKPPDSPSVTFGFKAEDIDVRNPNFPIYLAILKKAGYENLDQPDQQTGAASPVAQAMQQSAFQQQVMGMAQGGAGPQGSPPGLPTAIAGNRGLPEHGGTAPRADHLNKHQAEMTGDRSGPKVGGLV